MAEQQFHLRQLQTLLQSHAGSPWALPSGTRSHRENQNACNPAMPATLPDQQPMSLVNQSGRPSKSLGLSSMLEIHRWSCQETLQRCTHLTATEHACAHVDPAHAADATGSKSKNFPRKKGNIFFFFFEDGGQNI